MLLTFLWKFWKVPVRDRSVVGGGGGGGGGGLMQMKNRASIFQGTL